MSFINKYHVWLSECTVKLHEIKEKYHKAALAAICIKMQNQKRKNYRKKRYWIERMLQERKTHGFYHALFPVMILEESRFRNYFRMTSAQFENLLCLVAPFITKQMVIREPISAAERLSLTLRIMEAYRQRLQTKVICMILLHKRLKLIEEENRKFRRFWVRPILRTRRTHGNWEHLIQELRLYDNETYFNFMRMTPETFEEILSLVGSQLMRQTTNFREPICAEARLSLTIRYLASGDALKSLALAFRIGISTTSKIIRETCRAIWCSMQQEFLTPFQENWLRVHKEFALRWNFPHCVGALDGKHVIMTAPPKSGSSFYNYKGQHSIVLMALASADYKFLMVDIGAQGRHSDGGIFKNSEMGRRFSEGLMNLPFPSIIDPTHSEPFPFVFVADEAFQLNSFTMRPYPGRNLTVERRIFNYRLSRARKVVENAFGIMAARWRICHKPMNTSLATTEAIVQATTCLHNFMMTRDCYFDDSFVDHENCDSIMNSAWRENILQTGAIQNYHNTSLNNYSKEAVKIRDKFTEYFMNEGAIPWQWEV